MSSFNLLQLAQDLHQFLVEIQSLSERKDLMEYVKSTFGEDRQPAAPVPPVSLLPKIEAAGPMLSNSIAERAESSSSNTARQMRSAG